MCRLTVTVVYVNMLGSPVIHVLNLICSHMYKGVQSDLVVVVRVSA